jgi:hypothetical protein
MLHSYGSLNNLQPEKHAIARSDVVQVTKSPGEQASLHILRFFAVKYQSLACEGCRSRMARQEERAGKKPSSSLSYPSSVGDVVKLAIPVVLALDKRTPIMLAALQLYRHNVPLGLVQ